MGREIPQPEVREAIIQTEGELAVMRRPPGSLARWQLVHGTSTISPGLQSLLVDIKKARMMNPSRSSAEAVFAGRLDAACFCLRTIGRRRLHYGKPMTPEEESAGPQSEADAVARHGGGVFERTAGGGVPEDRGESL